ncbi:hypothetical protein SEA_OCTOBIEN14_144 [Gordonia phage Octobien14]|uniref:DUF7192 domain-containing protein n=1 Tax=Gordonia phage Octobien14 TaxID=2483673 RepID=A0A3G3M9X0_9CAUD|nr:hypothetical protein L3Y22_gp100 [Gordonia phage Octobien14]AYR03276.1 hypothetical protein SEA_OCTOBIEN14_144 [Gordonia phage Octobien14]
MEHVDVTVNGIGEVLDRLENILAQPYYQDKSKSNAQYWQDDQLGDDYSRKWAGAKSIPEAVQGLLDGLADEGIRAAEDAKDFVSKVAADSPAWVTQWDVTGHTVDVGAFLSGEPECMLYDTRIEAPSEVVEVVAQVGVHAGIKPKSVRAYGRQIMRLLLSVDAMGLQSELWVDWSVKGRDGRIMSTRIKAKSAGEYLDPGVIAYAVTSVATLRCILLPLMHDMSESDQRNWGVGGGYGQPANARPELYSAGAFILPRLRDNPDANRDIVTPVLDKLTGRTD